MRVPPPARLTVVMLGLLVVVLAQLWGAAAVPASPGGTLTVEPQKVAPGGTLTLEGWCARVLLPDGSLGPPPATTTVRLDGTALFTVSVASSSGTWGPVGAPVPAGTPAGSRAVRSDCGGVGTFTAVAAPRAPTLTVTPGRASLPVTVTVAGTCAPGTTSVRLFLDGVRSGLLDINQAVGEIQAVTVALGTDTPSGPHRFTTSCGGSATFTAATAPVPTPGTTSAPAPASPSVAPSATPSTERVVVPDLRGLTEQQAVVALGPRLHLARITGDSGRIRAQQPAPAALVPVGTAVDVTFEPAPRAASGNRALWLGVGVAAVLLAAGATAWALLRHDGGRGRPPGAGGGSRIPLPRPGGELPTVVGGPHDRPQSRQTSE